MDDKHTDGHEVNVDHGQIDGHSEKRIWYELVSTGTIRGSNTQP